MIVDDKLMRYVLFKRRTESEVRNKCRLLKYEESYIEEIIDYLKEANYINDKVYVEKYIANVMVLKHSSKNEIRIDLMRRGVDSDFIDAFLEDEKVEQFELESAIYLASKKRKAGDELEKIKKFLLNKGYSYTNISKAIDNWDNMNDNEEE